MLISRDGHTQIVDEHQLVMVGELFCLTVEATGGVRKDEAGYYVPAIDPEWIDLGEAYVAMCRTLGRVFKEEESL